MRFSRTLILGAIAIVLLSGAVFAQQDIPLTNWTVPPYNRASTAGGITTMTDVTPGIAFVGVAPCRLVDTRQAGFPAGYGTPSLAAGVPRNFDLNSDPLCTGIPAGVEAYSLNFTVTNVQGPGFLKVFPQGGAIPADISTLNYIPGNNTANAAIVPAGTGGGITVISGVSGTDLIIDINGYFTDEYNTNTSFLVTGTVNSFVLPPPLPPIVVPGVMATIANNSTTLSYGLLASTDGNVDGSAGVRGVATDADDTGLYGVEGVTQSTGTDGAGVHGIGDFTPNDAGNWTLAGVKGESANGWGVFGVSEYSAVRGLLTADVTGAGLANGYLGTSFGVDPGSGSAPWAVFGLGDIGASGTKHFVEPHPKDASLVIKYTSLEGPEVGTYFRGRAKFQNGIATIDVPEDFRMVTAEDGLSIQVTPIGDMATVAVAQIGLEKIVIRGSRNVEFFYTVNGVRRGYESATPIAHDFMFMPDSPEAVMPAYLNEHQKSVLISNGTYRPDGKVNPETARRLGWDKIWVARTRPALEPSPE